MKKLLKFLVVVSLFLGGSVVSLSASMGDTCDDPFVIPSLPFWQETTTVDFNADYDLGAGNGCTGHTTSGKDVVYKYTVPDTLDTVCITLSVIIPQDIWDAAIYILTDCENLVCVAGADDYGPGSPEAFTYALAPGETYYFVVDGREATDEGHYKFSISDCFSGERERLHGALRTALELTVSPNVTKEEANISFVIPERTTVSLSITDLRGRTVNRLVSSPLEAGLHRVSWNGRDEDGDLLPQGVYFVNLAAGSRRAIARIILLK